MGRRVATLAVSALVAACAVKSLDVGSDDGPALPNDGGVGADADAQSTMSLLETLAARCAAAEGQPDSYSSAATLSQHLSGRWYMCPQSNWIDDPPQGIELRFDTVGTWDFLVLDDAGATFSRSDNPEEGGEVLYSVPVVSLADGGTSEAGDGGGGSGGEDGSVTTPENVPVDDTTQLFGFSIELVRANLQDFRFVPSFEKSPRRMTLSELGTNPANAVFVPID